MKLLALLLVAAIAGGLLGCGREPVISKAANFPERGGGPTPVRTAPVEMRDFPVDEIVAPGKVDLNPNRVSKVLMPVPGRVRRVMVKLGDAVTEGEPVAVVESPEAGLALAAQAQAQSQVQQASVALAKTEKDLARVKELNANKAAPLKDVVNAETDLELARSALMQSKVTAEEAMHRLTMLGLDPARHSHDITVNAPISGKVLEVSVAPGELRNDTNQPLMTIADLRSVWVTSQVPESSIRLVQIDEPLVIELVAYPGEKFQGRVRRIADTVDPETRTVKVQAELSNAGGRLRPEMFARIRHSHGVRRLPCVPVGAIVHRDGAVWVMVERSPGKLERTRITPGEAVDGIVPVLDGLRQGEHVLVDGAALLRER
jgi:membrane fusion protein, heavy metal efflux system